METANESKAKFLVPATIFLTTGLVITFTQSLHENPIFNSWVIAVFGLLFAVESFLRWKNSNNNESKFVILAGSLASLALAVAVLVKSTQKSIHLALIIWAIVIVSSYVYGWVLTRTKTFLAPAIFGTLFVLILAFVARDLASVVGFFAAFSIMIGVYLAIAAFDPKKSKLQDSTNQTGIST